MDKEKAGFVKVDEEKLNRVRATLARKSKRGSLSDTELDLAKKLDEVLKRRATKPRKVDKNIGTMKNDPNYHPAPVGK